MDIDVNLILAEYDKIIMELQRNVILLKVENDQLKKLLEYSGKDSE